MWKKSLNSELANGRLAMTAILALFFQNGTVGTTGPEMWLGARSLRAFETELGVQSPVGFWDPLGLSADGDAARFKRRRTSEIKHGRLSMLAAIGYMVPETYRFPGYLSPSSDLKFADMPHGLAAISKVPLLGWGQIVLFAAFIELRFYPADPSREPGDYKNGGILGIP
ncbi:MAG: chlorophyll a/b-binding protein, partial [Candidatus Fonsibacter sp.]